MRKLFAIMAAGSLLVGGAAQAAPVTTDVQLGLTIQGLDSINITVTGVTVDVTGTTVTLPAISATGLGIIVPVTASTAINNINASTIGVAGGTFSAGGVTAQLPGEICPGGGPVSGDACNNGGGIGGAMALTGTVNVSIVPMIVVIPVNLGDALVGQGGSTNTPFTFNAAGWTTGTAAVNTPDGIVTIAGQGSEPFTLVTPTFLSALGNLLPIFTTVVLTNVGVVAVPEPGSLLLIGAGVAGLALLGSRRK